MKFVVKALLFPVVLLSAFLVLMLKWTLNLSAFVLALPMLYIFRLATSATSRVFGWKPCIWQVLPITKNYPNDLDAANPLTVDEEFLLTKRLYEQITGRSQKSDVIAYQIRQSFKPGEITAEEANKVGYELAMRFTKGKHAFVVATHTDRQHIHNHIIYNSTALDGTRKFKNFWLSSFAVQRLSDLICLEHQLSTIEYKPYRERQKRIVYPPKESNRDRLCSVIDSILFV